jgi:hypothetical protein
MVDRLFALTLPTLPNESDATAETLGTVVDIAADGWVTHLWQYASQFPPVSVPMRLYDESGQALVAGGTGTIVTPTASSWNSVALGGVAGGVPVTAGRYVVAAYTTKWAATSDFFAVTSYAAGDLIAAASGLVGGNGRFNASADAFPASSFRDTFYFTDISFTTVDPAAGGDEAEVPPPATHAAMGWETYLNIVREGRAEAAAERARRPLACPHDGEPLRVGPAGQLYCPYDGWQPA